MKVEKIAIGTVLIEDIFLEELLASHQLLRDHACHADHGKATMGEFLVLHLHQSIWIRGLQAERVPAQISWDPAILFHSPSVLVFVGPYICVRCFCRSRVRKLRNGIKDFWECDCNGNDVPELLQRRFLKSNV